MGPTVFNSTVFICQLTLYNIINFLGKNIQSFISDEFKRRKSHIQHQILRQCLCEPLSFLLFHLISNRFSCYSAILRNTMFQHQNPQQILLPKHNLIYCSSVYFLFCSSLYLQYTYHTLMQLSSIIRVQKCHILEDIKCIYLLPVYLLVQSEELGIQKYKDKQLK